LPTASDVDEQAGDTFFGTDRQGDAKVVLVSVGTERAKMLRPVVGLEHAHLARLLAVEPVGDGFAAIGGRGGR
jgi:hypothetical protein